MNWKDRGRSIIRPLTSLFVGLHIHPNALTIVGFLITVLSAYFYATGDFIRGAVVLAFAGLCDAFDGEVARMSNRVSKFGAALDSTLDRFSEFFIFGAFIYYFKSNIVLSGLLYFCLIFSISISYIRARGEGLGYSTKKGPMDRPMRYVLLLVISFVPVRFFVFLFSLFAVLTLYTMSGRLYDLKKHLK